VAPTAAPDHPAAGIYEQYREGTIRVDGCAGPGGLLGPLPRPHRRLLRRELLCRSGSRAQRLLRLPRQPVAAADGHYPAGTGRVRAEERERRLRAWAVLRR